MSAPRLDPEPLEPLVDRLGGAPAALIALGIPRCPACQMLPASLAALAGARPGLAVGFALLAGPGDWARREDLLWPRGIRVSRSAVPSLTLLRDGAAVARRDGGAPAHVLDAWLARELGAAEHPLGEGLTPGEQAILDATAARRVQHAAARGDQPFAAPDRCGL